MRTSSKIVKLIALFLSLLIMVSLSLAALGGLFEVIQLIYFWYLALFGITAVLALGLLLGVNKLFNVMSRHYHRIFMPGKTIVTEKLHINYLV